MSAQPARTMHVVSGDRPRPTRSRWFAALDVYARGKTGCTDYRLAAAVNKYFSTKHWRCYPGYSRLAEDTGLSVRAIQDSCQRRIKAGFLKWMGRPRHKVCFEMSFPGER